MTPLPQLRRVLNRARSGERQLSSDLEVLDAWLRRIEGKRNPNTRVNTQRIAEVLWQQEVLGRLQRHAIDAALALYPGASQTTVLNHLNRAKPKSRRLLRDARRMLLERQEDAAFDSREAKAIAVEIAAEGLSAMEDFGGS